MLMLLTLSLPRVINFKFLLQPHHKSYTTQYEELGFSSLTQMKDDYTINSHYLTYTFSLQEVGRMYFVSSGVKGLRAERECVSSRELGGSRGMLPGNFWNLSSSLHVNGWKCVRNNCDNVRFLWAFHLNGYVHKEIMDRVAQKWGLKHPQPLLLRAPCPWAHAHLLWLCDNIYVL